MDQTNEQIDELEAYANGWDAFINGECCTPPANLSNLLKDQ